MSAIRWLPRGVEFGSLGKSRFAGRDQRTSRKQGFPEARDILPEKKKGRMEHPAFLQSNLQLVAGVRFELTTFGL
jgi:hypothetical protein